VDEDGGERALRHQESGFQEVWKKEVSCEVMKRYSFAAIALGAAVLAQQRPAGAPPPIQPKPEELRQIAAKADELDAILREIKARGADEKLTADVEIYSKAGRFLLEFPQTFFVQEGIDQALQVLDQGIERARRLRNGESPWSTRKGRTVRGYYSALDGSVQPYGLTVPESYDGSKPTRLYVWLHGRDQRLSEASFISRFPAPNNGATYRTADVGQITLDAYGRWNNANHWAGEVDVFEAIEDVRSRYKIDPDRIILRGFSLGGAGAWHIALQYPDRFAAADIGAGTYPRRWQMPGFPPHQQATLRIWENILEWSLNAFNIPIAAHDGDNDTGVSGLPPVPGEKSRGQLESSLRVRAQLEKEGFPSEGEPNFLRAKGTPSIFLISENTGHSVSPKVRGQVDEFLKTWGDRGRVSPDHVRFATFTTRYDRCYWVTAAGLEKHYERSEVNAERDKDRRRFRITTKNLSRLTLRETEKAASVAIDGQNLRIKGSAELRLEKQGGRWRLAGKAAGLRKTHGLSGPIDDAFLDPFLLVRPTGVPWNEAANRQALRILARFDRVYARWYRAHPRVKDDTDVTDADLAKYNVALFGDPGSNRWIAKMNGKLPVVWSKDAVKLGRESFPAAEHLPALVYPNPLHPSRYVVLNSGLTIDEREYQSDYSMPRLGDFAALKVQEGMDTPEAVMAGLFDEFWRLP
jgi:pimeloyl-ACP methyl ester carboxylesterase